MSDIPLVPSGNRDMYEELAADAPPANNGEPCRNCGTSIAKTAHPVHRKRHVCSPRRNNLLKRRHKYAVNKARAEDLKPEIPGEDLLRVPGPRRHGRETNESRRGLPSPRPAENGAHRTVGARCRTNQAVTSSLTCATSPDSCSRCTTA